MNLMGDLTGDLGVLVFGIGITIIFLIGVAFTMKELQQMKDQRDTDIRRRNIKIKDE